MDDTDDDEKDGAEEPKTKRAKIENVPVYNSREERFVLYFKAVFLK